MLEQICRSRHGGLIPLSLADCSYEIILLRSTAEVELVNATQFYSRHYQAFTLYCLTALSLDASLSIIS